MYRKTEQSAGMGKSVPGDSPTEIASQSRSKGKPSPRPRAQQRGETPAPQPDLPIKTPPGQNHPIQGRIDEGANPNPTHKEGPATESQKVLDTLFSIHH